MPLAVVSITGTPALGCFARIAVERPVDNVIVRVTELVLVIGTGCVTIGSTVATSGGRDDLNLVLGGGSVIFGHADSVGWLSGMSKHYALTP